MKDREQNQAWIRNAVRAGAAAGTVFLSLVLAASLWLILSKVWLKTPVPSVFGFSPVYVLSGSMEPTFSTGDMIIIHPQREYRPGDVVTFRSEGELVTHRIISESKEGFTVKGDANNVRMRRRSGSRTSRESWCWWFPAWGPSPCFSGPAAVCFCWLRWSSWPSF